jgi:hypothetical protein
MEDKVLILPVDSQTFEVVEYSTEDTSLISSFELDTEFSKSSDYIEYYIFDENQNIIFPNSTTELLSYSVRDGHVMIDPKQDLQRNDFDEGNYYINYNFYRKHLNSDILNKYYIEEISSDRTEIRLNSTTISNSDIETSTNEFTNYRNTKDYFVDFYLNFGDNNLIIANNAQLDVINETDYSILIKLYSPLPSDFNLKSQCWVIEKISEDQSYQVKFPIPVFNPQDFEFIAGPNLSLDIKDETGVSSQEYSYDTLINSSITSSNSQIQSLLAEKGIKINVNYENFSNYVKFSSAKIRLENFYYKVGLIENYTNQITTLDSNITSNTSTSTEFSSSKAVFEEQINSIIKNFDGYEYFLYYNSGSDFSYPKSNSSLPYTLYSTGSTEVLEWIGSADSTNDYYGGLTLSASNYDENNQDYLYWNIPEYLRDDPNNRQYELFIDMVGQHFDNIWIYTKDIVNKFDADNRLNYGISKDLVADAIKDFGIKLYSNNYNTNDLYKSFLGITPSGNTFPQNNIQSYFPVSPGNEYIDTRISASNDIMPLDDVNKRLYKRIYHNIPYLLKTKGTIAGLRALITSYGIPDTVLRINEFGGKNKINKQDWDYKQNIFNYALEVSKDSYFSSSLTPNTNFSTTNPETIQFRFKTPGIPTSSTYQCLFATDTSNRLVIEYTGSSYVSGSHSGSIADPYNEYGTIKWVDGLNPEINVSAYLPIFNGEWWSIMLNADATTTSLSVANNIDNKIGFSSYDSDDRYSNFYHIADNATFPYPYGFQLSGQSYEPFSGSIQEIRYYSSSINTSSFEDFVLNPLSFNGNGSTTSDELIFRADLGSLSSTSSRESIHPKVTGSWGITSSFANGDSNFILENPTFVSNKEFIYQNQPFQGIKNKISDKISIFENILPEGDTLSSKRSIQQYSYLTQSTTPDADYLEVAFSPTNQINDDITAELGNFNIGDYIGDPRHISESRTNYPDLDKLRDQYFLKYIKSYDVKDFIRLIKYFDNSLFKMIKDFTPARTNLSAGVVVKQHLLERNTYSAIPVSYENQTYSGSVKSFPRNYSTGSSNSANYDPISGSSLYVSKGGTVGIFERFNGLTFSPSGSDGDGPNNVFGITQSWNEYFPSISGSVKYPRDDQREFYNGEFSQSSHIKLQRGLNIGEDDPCYEYTNWENVPDLLYRLEFFSGSNNAYRIESYTPPPPIVGDEYYLSPNSSYTPGEACQLTGSLSAFINVPSIHSINIDDILYGEESLENPIDGEGKWWGIRPMNSTLPNNQFSLKITSEGVILDKKICKVVYSAMLLKEATNNTLRQVVYNGDYSIGDFVNISNLDLELPISGCWEIIDIVTQSAIPSLEITNICTPVPPLLNCMGLGYHSSNPYQACSIAQNTPLDDLDQYCLLSSNSAPANIGNAIAIYDSGSIDHANPGVYSDGFGYRFWDGQEFIGNTTRCQRN